MIQQATPINWKYWKHMPEVKQWEACALSLGINPDRLEPHPQGWMKGPGAPIFMGRGFPSKAVENDFNNRTRLLEACVFKSPCFKSINGLTIDARHKATIALSEFVDWCASVELDIPAELTALWKSEIEQSDMTLEDLANEISSNIAVANKVRWTKHTEDDAMGLTIASTLTKIGHPVEGSPSVRQHILKMILDSKIKVRYAANGLAPVHLSDVTAANFGGWSLQKEDAQKVREWFKLAAPDAEEKAAHDIHAVRSQTHRMKNRTHLLDAEITKATVSAISKNDPASIWAELVKLAEAKPPTGCLIGFSSDGIQYRGKIYAAEGIPDIFTLKSLRSRINRDKAR